MNRAKSAIGGFLLLLLSNAWTWGLGLVEVAYVPRIIGDVNYGKLYLAGSILSAATVLVTFGGGSYVVRSVASNPEASDRFLCAVLAFRTLVGVPLIITLYFVMHWLVPDPLVLSLIAITGLSTYLLWVSDAVATFRQAHTHFGTLARSQMLAKTVGVLSRILLVLRGFGPVGAAFGDLIQVITGLISAWFSRASRIRITRVRVDDIKLLLRAGWPYFQYSFYLWLYGAPTTTYLIVALGGHDGVAGYDANGWFAIANRVLGLFYLFPGIIVGVLMPLLVSAYEESRDEYLAIARRALSPALVLCIPFSLLLVLRADVLMRALGYSAQFDNVPLVLRIAGANMLFRWVSSYYGMLLIAANRIDRQARAALFAAPFNLITTTGLVILFTRQWHNGAAGAMLASEMTEVLVVCIYAHALRDTGLVPANLRAVGRGLLAGVVPAAILLLAPMPGRLAFAGVTLLALAAFLPAALLTGAMRREDLEPLLRAARARVHAR